MIDAMNTGSWWATLQFFLLFVLPYVLLAEYCFPGLYLSNWALPLNWYPPAEH